MKEKCICVRRFLVLTAVVHIYPLLNDQRKGCSIDAVHRELWKSQLWAAAQRKLCVTIAARRRRHQQTTQTPYNIFLCAYVVCVGWSAVLIFIKLNLSSNFFINV